MRSGPFGTTLGYIVPGDLPVGTSYAGIERILGQAARSLRLTRAICMVDFIIGPDGPVLLELAPRPGGDCLPPLIRHAAGLDMLGLALDVAQGWPIELPTRHAWKRHVGMRIYARKKGVLADVDVRRVACDPRVVEVYLSRRPGHVVVLPPFDYDSWSLGYVIFQPSPDCNIEIQCDELMAHVRVAMDEAA
jgi:biotin carboxylase